MASSSCPQRRRHCCMRRHPLGSMIERILCRLFYFFTAWWPAAACMTWQPKPGTRGKLQRTPTSCTITVHGLFWLNVVPRFEERSLSACFWPSDGPTTRNTTTCVGDRYYETRAPASITTQFLPTPAQTRRPARKHKPKRAGSV